MPADRSSPAPSANGDALLNACTRCKQRKKKCDRVRPNCANCAKAGADCVYDVPVTDAQQKALIAQLSREASTQQAKIAELEKQLEAAVGAAFSGVSPSILTTPIDLVQQAVDARYASSIAEHLVSLAYDSGIDTYVRDSLPACTAGSLGIPLEQLTSLNAPRPASLAVNRVNSSYLPQKQVAESIINSYFEFTNALHPCLDRETLADDLVWAYPANPQHQSPLDRLTAPYLQAFRLFMVLAIGSNVRTEHRTDAAMLRACAAAHFPAALRADLTTALQCIVLYCLVSTTDSASMDTYRNVRRTAQLAMKLELHKEDLNLQWAERDLRRRIFWSIFCMDRSICFTLVRPVIIPEDQITVSLPTGVPELAPCNTRFLRPINFFYEVVLLRRLQGMVASAVATTPPGPDLARVISTRNSIDEWYEAIPRNDEGQVHPYLECNYHLLMVKLYTPSPQTRHVTPTDLVTLRVSALAVIEQYSAGKHEFRIAQNHITMAHIVACCLALLYSLLENEGNALNFRLVSWRKKAVNDIASAETLLQRFCVHSPHAAQYSAAYVRIVGDLKTRLHEAEKEIDTTWAPAPPSCAPVANVPVGDPFAIPDDLNWGMSLDPGITNDLDFSGEGSNIDDILASFGIGAFQT